MVGVIVLHFTTEICALIRGADLHSALTKTKRARQAGANNTPYNAEIWGYSEAYNPIIAGRFPRNPINISAVALQKQLSWLPTPHLHRTDKSNCGVGNQDNYKHNRCLSTGLRGS